MKQEIEVFTDSSNNVLTINLSKVPDNNTRFDIYNKSGEHIKRVKIFERITSIEIESLAPGLYLLICISGKKIKAFRFLKE